MHPLPKDTRHWTRGPRMRWYSLSPMGSSWMRVKDLIGAKPLLSVCRGLFFQGLLVGFAAGFLMSCATSPPSHPQNICDIFEEKAAWYPATLEAESKWGVPVEVQMAIVRHESSFVADAKPPRQWFLGFIPLSRPSTAYGYSQALDGTWERYQNSTDQGGAERDDFGDAVDFIGWYSHETQKELGIPPSDAYRLYLAYHEGQAGYRRGSYRAKPWLLGVAQSVDKTARRYQHQLKDCPPD